MNEAELFRKDKFCKLRKKNKKDKQGSTIKTLNPVRPIWSDGNAQSLKF